MPFQIVKEKITKLDVEAVVSSDDTNLSHSGGVSWAIAQAAGEGRIQRFTQQYIPLEVTNVVVSPGYNLKADYIIHCSVPEATDSNVEKRLAQTYQNIFKEVERLGIQSVALPLLSSGQYGLPKDILMQIALNETKKFLKDISDIEVFLALHNQDVDRIPYEIYEDLKDYLEENLETEKSLYGALEKRRLEEVATDDSFALENNLHTFKAKLFQMMDLQALDDSEICHKANISRELFAKIRANEKYIPNKTIIFALVIALESSIEEVEELLASAGYSCDSSEKTDVIMEYFIINQIYDIFTINETLYEFGEKQLI